METRNLLLKGSMLTHLIILLAMAIIDIQLRVMAPFQATGIRYIMERGLAPSFIMEWIAFSGIVLAYHALIGFSDEPLNA